MSRFAEQLLVRITLQELRLHSCCARLAAGNDGEALHALRINLRTLRSLLRPLRGLPAIDLLEQSAAALGRLSNPLRESQVLVRELQQLGLATEVADYAIDPGQAAGQLLSSTELQRLFEVFDGLPGIWRLAAREGCLRDLRKRIRRHQRRDVRKLHAAQVLGTDDLHALRLRIKRLRYASEVYPQLSRLDRRERALLRQLQKILGDWNDCQHWLACAAVDSRLAQCQALWEIRAAAAATQAHVLLGRFLPRVS
jgi:CHAD domain-containing protein